MIVRILRDFACALLPLRRPSALAPRHGTAFAAYSARGVAGKYAALFDRVVNDKG